MTDNVNLLRSLATHLPRQVGSLQPCRHPGPLVQCGGAVLSKQRQAPGQADGPVGWCCQPPRPLLHSTGTG